VRDYVAACRTWLAIQRGLLWIAVASAHKFDAPSTATRSSTSITSPSADRDAPILAFTIARYAQDGVRESCELDAPSTAAVG
jgi:hypothetical protein